MYLQKILVAYNGFERSEPIPGAIVHLAKAKDAEILLFHVVATDPRWGLDIPEGFEADRLAHRKQTLEALAATLRASGVQVRVLLGSGVPYLEIIREALRQNADLVAVLDEPQAGEKWRGFGPVTQKLLRKCPLPVLALRSTHQAPFQNVLAALDLGPDDTHHNVPNPEILAWTESLGQMQTQNVYLFHAWSVWAEEFLRKSGRMNEAEIKNLEAEQKRLSVEALTKQLKTHPWLEAHAQRIFEQGEAARLLPKYSQERGIDLVVMGTVARVGLPGWIIGNTAEKILNQLECSVFAVKPRGFEGHLASASK